jgi:hypothetical protein
MLELNGGWEVKQMEKFNFVENTPQRLITEFFTSVATTSENLLDKILFILTDSFSNNINNNNNNNNQQQQYGKVREIANEFKKYLQPYIQPIITTVDDFEEAVRFDPKVTAALNLIEDFEKKIVESLNNNNLVSQLNDEVMSEKVKIVNFFENNDVIIEYTKKLDF